MAAHRVAVVGAGLAGLAAGLDLARSGYDVEVFERSRLLGGRATSFFIDGIEVDNGQHVFLGCCTEFVRFVEQVGMADRLHVQERFEALVLAPQGASSRLRAARLPAPWHLAGSFFAYRHLALRDKLRLTKALRAAGKTPPDGTFAQWLASHGQSEGALRAFWRPFFVPALNASLEDVSAKEATFVLSTAFLSDARAARIGYATVPLAHVASKAAQAIGCVHTSTPVRELLFSRGDRWTEGLVLEDGRKLSFDAVVLALAPPQLARVLGDAAPALGLPALAGYVARPIVDVHVWHDRGHLGFDFAAVLDSPLQWVFEKHAGYLCCSFSDAQAHVNAPTQEVTQQCWNELLSVVPALEGATLVRSAVTRNPHATYAPAFGIERPGPRTACENLAIAGSWTNTGWPDTMESAVRSGNAAAHAIAATLGGVAVVA